MSNVERISKELDADRARLANTLNDLTDTVSSHSVAKEVSDTIITVGCDLAQKAWSTLRDQPAGCVLVALGLGLLAAGSQRPQRPVQTAQRNMVDPITAMDGFDARVAAADRQLRDEMTGEIDRLPRASRLRAALDTGLGQLPPQARQRVIKARKAVISAQEKVEEQPKRAARKSKGFIVEQPLAAGALAVGFGTLLGTLLPGTRQEDALLGERRDALMAEARNALEEEMLKTKAKAAKALHRAAKPDGELHL